MNSQDSFIIHGLSGKQSLHGAIPVRGAKNAATKMLAASLLFEDEVVITNAPQISDMAKMEDLLTSLGASVYMKDDTIRISAAALSGADINHGSAQRIRASVALTGPLLSRCGKVSFPHPGGDVIGRRPLDLFLRAFEKMGAEVVQKGRRYDITSGTGGLHGADIFLDIRSVGATETIMMAGVLARGTTILRNAALEPEILSVAEYLRDCGAKIDGIGTHTLEIHGGGMLSARGRVYRTIPDRIETGSFIVLGALAAEELRVINCEPTHLRALLSILERVGVRFDIEDDAISVYGGGDFSAVNVRTDTYPGLATDFQPPLVVLLTQARGESMVFETLFDGRLNYTDGLQAMGADITMFDPHRILVRGPSRLHARTLDGPDIRAGLAFVLSGIVAEGVSTIHNVSHIDRGYERVEERLKGVGVSIERVKA